MIPARIIQTAKHCDLTLKQRAFTTNLQLLNRDYEWCFFDNQSVDRFVDKEFPHYRALFDSFPFSIQRYDFFRYLAVYRLGGFYFDLDVLLATKLSELRTHTCVFPFEGLTFSRLLRAAGMDWQIGNYAFGATPGHPFLKAIIDNCVRAQREPSWAQAMMPGVPFLSRRSHSVLHTTGPGLVSRTLAENCGLRATVTVLFPGDVCDIESWNRFGDFGIHFMDGTWRPPVGLVRRRMTLRYEAWSMRRLIRKSRRFGKARSVGGRTGKCRVNADGVFL